jgi:hypothetical protein
MWMAADAGEIETTSTSCTWTGGFDASSSEHAIIEAPKTSGATRTRPESHVLRTRWGAPIEPFDIVTLLQGA